MNGTAADSVALACSCTWAVQAAYTHSCFPPTAQQIQHVPASHRKHILHTTPHNNATQHAQRHSDAPFLKALCQRSHSHCSITQGQPCTMACSARRCLFQSSRNCCWLASAAACAAEQQDEQQCAQQAFKQVASDEGCVARCTCKETDRACDGCPPTHATVPFTQRGSGPNGL